MYKKKYKRVQKGQIIDEDTASVTNGGHSKEGMKWIIFGLSKEKRLLLEQNKLLRKKVEKLERVARSGDENVQARTFSEHLKEKLFNWCMVWCIFCFFVCIFHKFHANVAFPAIYAHFYQIGNIASIV